jgi:hypothetical protein
MASPHEAMHAAILLAGRLASAGAWMHRQNPLFAEQSAAKERVFGAKANLLRRSGRRKITWM